MANTGQTMGAALAPVEETSVLLLREIAQIQITGHLGRLAESGHDGFPLRTMRTGPAAMAQMA